MPQSFSLSFNSRVRGGRDVYWRFGLMFLDVSTHASAGDATIIEIEIYDIGAFQLTRPRGTRLLRVTIKPVREVSTHASAGDATRLASR